VSPSITANRSYTAVAIAPIVTSPANVKGIRIGIPPIPANRTIKFFQDKVTFRLCDEEKCGQTFKAPVKPDFDLRLLRVYEEREAICALFAAIRTNMFSALVHGLLSKGVSGSLDLCKMARFLLLDHKNLS
jgi:hypothetical protein